MAYTRRQAEWKNYPDTTTPIRAEDLNAIEAGLEDAAGVADTALGLASTASAMAQSADEAASAAEAAASGVTARASAAEASAASASASASSAASSASAAASAASASATSASNAAALVGAPAGSAIDAYLNGGSGSAAGALKVSPGGEAAGVGTGGTSRPNVQLGGLINGTTIQSDQIHGVILQPGGPGFNNIIGGDGTATVNTATPNVASAVGNCGVSLIGGYDNVAGSISSKIIADHCYTEVGGSGHNAIFGGAIHVIKSTSAHAMIAGGLQNVAAGSYSLTSGFHNTNNGSSNLVVGNTNTVATSSGSNVFGQNNTVNDSYCDVSGYGNTVNVTALFSNIKGAYAVARSPFLDIRSGGKIANNGDAQMVRAHYQGQTTSTTAKLLVAAYTGTGSNSQYLMVQGQSAIVSVTVIAKTAAGATVGAWRFEGAVQWLTGNAAPTWLAGSAPTATVIYSNGSGAAPSLLLGAGGSAGRLFVSCAGVTATTINWSARLESVEVMA